MERGGERGAHFLFWLRTPLGKETEKKKVGDCKTFAFLFLVAANFFLTAWASVLKRRVTAYLLFQSAVRAIIISIMKLFITCHSSDNGTDTAAITASFKRPCGLKHSF